MTDHRFHRPLVLAAGAVVAVLAVTGGVAALTSGTEASPVPGDADQPGVVADALTAPAGFVEALAAVFDDLSPASTGQRLTIETGHCWVEPVTFDGERWNVPFDQQFGWGGLEPENWQGSGVMTRLAEDKARFDDDGGASVRFLLVDDPAVTPVEEAICM